MLQQICGVLINPASAGAYEFVLAEASGEQAYPECARTAGCKHIPDAIPYHACALDGLLQRLGRGQEEVGVRLAAFYLVARDDGHLCGVYADTP